ncbi:GroES-like protein [Dentipellis sp. KUC8613]|nr:GroES-like protein [Dentipellis sp. KUC8613]
MPSPSLPKTQKAAVLQKDLVSCAVETIPVDPPGPGEVLVKNTVAAQNPTDWKSIHFKRIRPGQSTGCDFAGVVAAVGEGVTNVAVGERVAGWCRSGGGDMSSFREYTLVPAHPLIKLPDNVSDEEAATLPLAIATAVVGLRRLTNYPQAAPYNRYILVWGGSSSVGLYAIQLAHLSSYKVITTASPRNHELVKKYGADVVVDYHAPDVVEQIIKATGKQGGVDYVFDAISESGSVQLSVKSLRANGARKVAVVLPLEEDGLDPSVEYTLVLCLVLLGSDVDAFGRQEPRDERNYQFGIEFYEQVAGWLRTGQLKGNPYTVQPGGLAGVQDGLTLMKSGKVSGTKLVYRIADTP